MQKMVHYAFIISWAPTVLYATPGTLKPFRLIEQRNQKTVRALAATHGHPVRQLIQSQNIHVALLELKKQLQTYQALQEKNSSGYQDLICPTLATCVLMMSGGLGLQENEFVLAVDRESTARGPYADIKSPLTRLVVQLSSLVSKATWLPICLWLVPRLVHNTNLATKQFKVAYVQAQAKKGIMRSIKALHTTVRVGKICNAHPRPENRVAIEALLQMPILDKTIIDALLALYDQCLAFEATLLTPEIP